MDEKKCKVKKLVSEVLIDFSDDIINSNPANPVIKLLTCEKSRLAQSDQSPGQLDTAD